MTTNPPLKKLRELRLKNGLTMKDIAQEVGMSPSMYSYVEMGKKRLSYAVAVAIADFFSMTPDELFYEDYDNFFSGYVI